MFGVKYRPLDFESVLGLDNIKIILQKIIKSQNYDPAYLFEGSYSSGKTTLGRIFARSVFCENRREDQSPCNECPSCKAFLSERHPGYLEIDAANQGTKEKIKEIMESLAYETVTKYKIILFDECHNISKEGKDALLKQLERDSNNVIFIFCTTEKDKMPSTISSRCMNFNIQEPTEANIKKKLQYIAEINNLKYDLEALNLLVWTSGRHYRDAENRLRQVSLLGPISEENTKKILGVYIDEIAALLISIPEDLSKSINIGDIIVSKMNIKDIYETILKLIVDSIKVSKGFEFDSPHYMSLLREIERVYGSALYEVLDFIISKNKMSDLVYFQSDLLLIHHKFLKNQFEPKTVVRAPIQKEKNDSVSSANDSSILEKINSSNSWDRADKVRSLKMGKRGTVKDSKTEEMVSKTWGPQIDKSVATSPIKKELSAEEFRKMIGGSNYDEKV